MSKFYAFYVANFFFKLSVQYWPGDGHNGRN